MSDESDPSVPPMIDAGFDAFAKEHNIEEHLAAAVFRSLHAHLDEVLVVDRSVGRRALPAGKLLAAALALGRRWEKTIPEERVGVVFPASLGGIIANLALVLVGKVPVNLNFTAGRKALLAAIEQAGIKTTISAAPVHAKLPKDFPWTDHYIDLVREREELSKVKIAAYLLQLKFGKTDKLLKRFRIPTEGGDREAGLLFSSGSTGIPKGVVLTHRNVLANCYQIQSCGLLDPGEVVLGCLPIFHSFGFTVTLWYPLLRPLKVVTMPSPLETKRIAETIEEEKVTVMMGTPTFYRPYFTRVDARQIRSLRYVVGGAEKTPPGFHDKWEKQFGSRYLEGYGLTETSPVVCCNLPPSRDGKRPAQIRRGAVGKLFPGMRGRISNPATGEPQSLYETGMLELQGPNVFPGYLENPDLTSEVFKDGWFVSGDLGRFDEDGYLYIEGRLSRFSKIGGEMVPHGTIEQAIMRAFHLEESEHPLVAVTGVADESKGEALILLTANDGVNLDNVRERLAAEGMPNLWIPRRIRHVEAIPTLASGKLDLQALKRLANEEDEPPPAEATATPRAQE